MFTSNTETGIAATYQDADGTIDLVVGTLNQDTTGTAATVTGAAQTAITSVGTLTALTVDDITINGSTISDASNFTLDVEGDINFDANGSDITLLDGGTEFGRFKQVSSGMRIATTASDADMTFYGNDGGSEFTALTLDMSNNGDAIFNGHLYVPSAIIHTGDVDTKLDFNQANTMRLIVGDITSFVSTTGSMVINEDGADMDFRVESDGNANMLWVDASNNAIAIGSDNLLTTLHVDAADSEITMNVSSAMASNGTWQGIGFGARNSMKGAILYRRTTNYARGQLLFCTENTADNSHVDTGNIRMAIEADGTIQLGNPDTGAATNVCVMPTGKLFLDAGGNTYVQESSGDVIDVVVGGSRKLRVNSNGLIFNADTAAANALNDYDEGTWTPALDNITTNSTTTAYGIYTKIGRIVHIHAKIDVTVASLPGQQFQISGLPFAATNTSDTGQRAIIAIGGDAVNLGAAASKSHFVTNGSTLQGRLWNASANTAIWYYNGGDGNSIQLHVHGHYTT